MKTPTRIAAKHSIKNNMTFATVNWLRWYWPEQLLFWAVFGHTASTIRAIMNVKTLLMWTTVISIFKAQKPSLTYHTVDMAGREKLSHMFQNRRHSRSSWIERYSDLFYALHQPLCAWVSICNNWPNDDRQKIWWWGLWNRSAPQMLVPRSK